MTPVHNGDYRTLNDGCEGDEAGLKAALGDNYQLIHEQCDDEGYGAHSYNAIFLTGGGRWIAANCGGCSCFGHGDWYYVDSREEAIRMIPEQERPEDL